MADNQNKTVATDGSVEDFLAGIADEQRRADARLLIDVMRDLTGHPPVLWGTTIIGFGSRHYRYASGREGDVPAIGFAPRKAETTVYLTGAMADFADLLATLGPHRTGKGCLYLKRVDRADPAALREIIARSYRTAGQI